MSPPAPSTPAHPDHAAVPADAPHVPDDRFIPVAPDVLAAAITLGRPSLAAQARSIARLTDLMAHVIAQESHELDAHLHALYADFNPDHDTITACPAHDRAPPVPARPDRRADLLRSLEYLFDKANFRRLTDLQLRAVVRAANSQGLRVRIHPERLDHLSVWVRGRALHTQQRRTLRRPFRGQAQQVRVYQRLVFVSCLKADPAVHLKLFREIPSTDVEALLPNAEVSMGTLDRIRIIGGGAGLVGSSTLKLVNLLNVAAGLANWSKILWIILIGGLMLTLRAVFGFRSARRRRDSQRTQHLYYQNMANNAAAIHTLVSLIKHEELKEAMLAYAALLDRPREIRTTAELAADVEAWLSQHFGVAVHFDAADAERTLRRLGLCTHLATRPVLNPDDACRVLERDACTSRTAGHHVSTLQLLRELL